MRGEYHLIASLKKGLPFLKVAATHGHREAMKAYGGHYIQAGIIQMRPFMGLSAVEAAEEGMMWYILQRQLGAEISETDKETFRVLLDPKVPFPEGFFRGSSGTAWMLQMVSPRGLDRARNKAYAWRNCWTNE